MPTNNNPISDISITPPVLLVIESGGKLYLLCNKSFNKNIGTPSQIICGNVTYTVVKNSRKIQTNAPEQFFEEEHVIKSLHQFKDLANYVIAGKLSRNKNLTTTKSSTQSLSSREKQVLHLIAQGLSSKSIANELDISTHTVNSYHKTIFRKLDVKSKIQALIVARSLGIL